MTLSVTFPSSYKNLVKKYNAGIPEKKIFKDNKGKEFILASLLNLKINDEEPSLLETYNDLNDRLPENTVPFGCDPFGNFFCFVFYEN